MVAEHRDGSLSRRGFLAALGGTTAAVAAGALAGDVRPASAQKKITVTLWDTEPNPATRAAVKAIVDADISDLAEVEGIGKTIAAAIHDILRTQYVGRR